MLTDTHAHLFWDSYKDDFDQVLQNALDAGVTTIVNVGVDVKTSKEALRLAQRSLSEYSLSPVEGIQLYSTIAIHPEDAVKYFSDKQEVISGACNFVLSEKIQKDVAILEQIYLENPNQVIAVGECGLDYAYLNQENYLPGGCSPDLAKQLQRQLLQAQIDLAKKLNLPLLLHVRDDRSKNPELIDCWQEIVELVKNHYGVFHCYSGFPPTTNYILQNTNFLFSFAGNITYKNNQYLRDAIKTIPLERVVLETDCPFLPPQSIRGKRNEPSSIKEIAQTVAELKGVPFEKVAQQTTLNFQQLIQKSV